MNEDYGLKIEANGLNEARLERIRDVLFNEWDIEEDEIHFEPQSKRTAKMSAVTMGEPNGMEPPKEFAERIATAIWRGNGSYCEIRISTGINGDYIVLGVRDYRRIILR